MAATVKKFYNLFWSDLVCQSIFSVHKGQLLEDEVELIVTKEKFYARRLVLTNSQKRKAGTAISQRNQNENIELLYNIKAAAKKYFDEERIESYILQKFGRTFKKLEHDLSKTGGWFKLGAKLISSLDDESDLFKLLSDYQLIPKRIEDSEQFSAWVEAEFNSEIRKFLDEENLSDLAVSIDLISIYYNNKIKNNLVNASKHYTDVLYDHENYAERLELFDNLYEIGVLKGGTLKSYFECVKCSPNTFNGIITCDLKPSNLKLKCPGCGKDLLYVVPYELEERIYHHIIDKDGLLFHAIEYLLETNNYRFKSNHMVLSDIEFDFCLQNDDKLIYEIVEVKMFKTDRPIDTQVGNIRTAIGQIKKAIDKIEAVESGYKHISKSLVTNVVDDTVYKLAKTELKSDLEEYNINIYTVADFQSKIISD